MIEARGLERTYELGEARVEALRGVDVTVRPGEYIAISGPSGSGKSTLMHILGLLERPTAGRYTLAGADTAQLDDNRRATLRNRTASVASTAAASGARSATRIFVLPTAGG